MGRVGGCVASERRFENLGLTALVDVSRDTDGFSVG